MSEKPQNPTEQEIAEAQLEAELEKWNVLGVEPANWSPAGGILSIVLRLDVLNEVLKEAGLLPDDAEMNLRMIRLSTARLSEIRELLAPQLAQAKLNAIRNGDLGRQH